MDAEQILRPGHVMCGGRRLDLSGVPECQLLPQNGVQPMQHAQVSTFVSPVEVLEKEGHACNGCAALQQAAWWAGVASQDPWERCSRTPAGADCTLAACRPAETIPRGGLPKPAFDDSRFADR